MHYATLLLALFTFIACGNDPEANAPKGVDTMLPDGVVDADAATVNNGAELIVTPIEHASAVLSYGDKTIHLDPVGGIEPYADYSFPDLILLTDIHPDHMDPETLEMLDTDDNEIIAPQAVAEKLPAAWKDRTSVLANGESTKRFGLTIEAVPMYNLRTEALKFHPKGRGNGYVLTTANGTRYYFSGDTEDTPELRNLENIDVAYVSMNLPYTMPVDAAASGVIEMGPDKVIPYHYRGKDGLSDTQRFKELVNAGNQDIEVELVDWYPNREAAATE